MKFKVLEKSYTDVTNINMDLYIYYILILKNLFEGFFGTHYPIEIIKVIVLILYKPIQMIAGCDHTILIRGGDTYIWGSNKYGQLGLGDNISRNSPQKLPLKNIKSISCGPDHTIALTESNKIYVWGSNDCGQLGLGDYNSRNSPQELILDTTSEIQIPVIIACGAFHNVALTVMGDIYIWGGNNGGRLGLGDAINRNTPQKFYLSNIKSVSCGHAHTVILTKTNEIYIWGHNMLPAKVSLREVSNSIVKSIVCGEDRTIILTSDNKIHCHEGIEKLSLDNIKSISCGMHHITAITIFDEIYIWGRNYFGQLGLGNNGIHRLPTKLMLKNVDTIVCGTYNTFAITNLNDVYVWGMNDCGQLGLGDYVNRNTPCKFDFKF